jgi:hypothetical protein
MDEPTIFSKFYFLLFFVSPRQAENSLDFSDFKLNQRFQRFEV